MMIKQNQQQRQENLLFANESFNTMPLMMVTDGSRNSVTGNVYGIQDNLGQKDPLDILPASVGYETFDSLFGLDPFVFPSPPRQAPVAPVQESFLQPSELLEDAFDFFNLPVQAEPELSIISSRTPASQKRARRVTKSTASVADSDKRERNRLAAERCRQRKAQLIESLQTECEQLRLDKERLLLENARLLRALGIGL